MLYACKHDWSLLKVLNAAGVRIDLSNRDHYDHFRQSHHDYIRNTIASDIDLNQGFPCERLYDVKQCSIGITFLIIACVNRADSNQQDDLIGGPLYWIAYGLTLREQLTTKDLKLNQAKDNHVGERRVEIIQ